MGFIGVKPELRYGPKLGMIRPSGSPWVSLQKAGAKAYDNYRPLWQLS